MLHDSTWGQTFSPAFLLPLSLPLATPYAEFLAQDGSSMSTGELKASVQLSEANIRPPGAAAADGSSSSSSGLPTLPQEVVAKLLEALWTPMYTVRVGGFRV
jgi:hypothetical protein